MTLVLAFTPLPLSLIVLMFCYLHLLHKLANPYQLYCQPLAPIVLIFQLNYTMDFQDYLDIFHQDQCTLSDYWRCKYMDYNQVLGLPVDPPQSTDWPFDHNTPPISAHPAKTFLPPIKKWWNCQLTASPLLATIQK